MQDIKQPNHYIYSKISMNTKLIDTRPYSYGIEFGTVEEVCRQLGIKYKEIDGRTEYSAPQARLQLFIEKLHFAAQPYSKS